MITWLVTAFNRRWSIDLEEAHELENGAVWDVAELNKPRSALSFLLVELSSPNYHILKIICCQGFSWKTNTEVIKTLACVSIKILTMRNTAGYCNLKSRNLKRKNNII